MALYLARIVVCICLAVVASLLSFGVTMAIPNFQLDQTAFFHNHSVDELRTIFRELTETDLAAFDHVSTEVLLERPWTQGKLGGKQLLFRETFDHDPAYADFLVGRRKSLKNQEFLAFLTLLRRLVYDVLSQIPVAIPDDNRFMDVPNPKARAAAPGCLGAEGADLRGVLLHARRQGKGGGWMGGGREYFCTHGAKVRGGAARCAVKP